MFYVQRRPHGGFQGAEHVYCPGRRVLGFPIIVVHKSRGPDVVERELAAQAAGWGAVGLKLTNRHLYSGSQRTGFQSLGQTQPNLISEQDRCHREHGSSGNECGRGH